MGKSPFTRPPKTAMAPRPPKKPMPKKPKSGKKTATC